MSELLSYILSHEDAFRKARLPSLYSDFSPQKQTNPDGYNSNVTAWQRALANAALAGHVSSLSSSTAQKLGSRKESLSHRNNLLVLRTGNTLMADLEMREWGRPLSLQCAIDEAIRSGNMIFLDTFLNSQTSPFKSGWLRLPSPPSLSQVVTWGMKQARGLVMGSDSDHLAGTGMLQTSELVLVDNVKQAASRLMKGVVGHHNSSVDRIYSKEMFMLQFAHIFGEETLLSTTDFNVLLTYLSRDRNIVLYDGKTVKFRDTSDTSDRITQEDGAIASLKTTIARLTLQVTTLGEKIKELTASAQNALASKNRILALSSLRLRKLAERNLQQRTDTLWQLEEIYSKVEQAATQVDIVRVMQASTGALRQLNSQLGGVDKVEDVVEELRKEMDNVDELGGVMNEAGPVIDETELDDELQELEDQEREAREEKETEETRQRLAELEKNQGVIRTPASGGTDNDLKESIDKLSQMSIGDKRSEREKLDTKPLPESAE
ncbi:SNF7 family protein [Microsporum canis CBS 113480]|uniref:SNF7 family protein n=1 Tax=Arthroderma otae (strain ATCC MYA-4605 / CBS 113480) TaxID=554155 RepID=C5FMF1_ARTOC|nr:SNF7 family protein [Microsporum canis CBS 113480]EEQ31054.1 SNF7 family protein [Microsporum canis CBS 113480]